MTTSFTNRIPDASIIVLNYNTKSFLRECIQSLSNSNFEKYNIELIIVDNASTDNSFSQVKNVRFDKENLSIKYLELPENIGFSAGNNNGLKLTNTGSRYVIFINPDTQIDPDTISNMISYLDNDQGISAATCYVELASTGLLQPECHRGFPTPLNAFWHFFGFGLPKLFHRSKFFNGYYMGYLDFSKPQQIDCCVGAFIMVRRFVGNAIGWWNEKYFFYGEDIDFCYQLKKHNYRLFYIPYWKITHYQGVSSGIIDHSKNYLKVSRSTKIRSAMASVSAMRLFYENNLLDDYPPILRVVVLRGIKLLEIYRLFKAKHL